MRITAILILILCLYACQSPTAIGKQLEGADSLVINFNTPGTNNIDHSVTTTETKAIHKLANFVDSKPSQAFKCSYDGNLLFYKKGIVAADISFNYSGEGCHHFIQQLNGTLTPTTLSNEAADFLSSLASGKGWY